MVNQPRGGHRLRRIVSKKAAFGNQIFLEQASLSVGARAEAADFSMHRPAVHFDFRELGQQTPRIILAGVCFVSRFQLGIEVRLSRYDLRSGESARPSVGLT